MNPVRRASAAHCFVDDLAVPALSDEDAHHLLRVLRIRPDQPITVSDGRGGWATATIAAPLGRGRGAELGVTGPVELEAAPAAMVIAVATPKGERADLVVEKLTELGASSILLAELDRSVVRADPGRAARQVERLARIARGAAMQSRRVWLPTVEVGVPFDVILQRFPHAALAEPDGGPIDPVRDDPLACVVIGPEGGFSERERAATPRRVGLGQHILRVETAALAAAVRWAHTA